MRDHTPESYEAAMQAVVGLIMDSIEGEGVTSQEQPSNRQASEMISTKLNERPYPSIEVLVEGMGTCCTPNDSPIYLELFEGKWWLRVWADINQEDPTHTIDMSGAFELARKEEA
jgi:hypothetical protein